MRLFTIALTLLAAATVASAADSDAPVSFNKDLRPLLNANCNACHKPDKSKADLDMTTFASLMKGGKHGAIVDVKDPAKSKILEQVRGPDPEMPPEGEGKPLTAEQISLLERWIRQGAKDDTLAPGTAKIELPVYTVPPVVTSLAWSPDGSVLAVAGYHEVLLHKGDGSGIIARLVGESPRIESIAFSKDGSLIGVAGGAPSEFGQVQIWDAKSHAVKKVFQPSADSLYGLSFAPDGKTVAVGGADKTVRRISVDDGKILTDFRAHADWVLATTFTLDGKTIVSGGRDKAMKLIDVETGRFVDDINNPVEQILCMTRNPKEEQVLYGGDLGVARIYKISDNQGRTSGRIDTNLLVQFERLPAAVMSVAWKPDGSQVALGTIGEVRIYDAKGKPADPAAKPAVAAKPPKGQPRMARKPAAVSNKAVHTLDGFTGPVFAMAFKPDGSVLAAAGFDGKVRLFDTSTGELIKEFVPVPIKAHE
jgi:WD40 repeat protein/mono/diheme cytochrome c family protein